MIVKFKILALTSLQRQLAGGEKQFTITGRVRNSLLPGLSIALMAIRYIRALLLLFTTRLLTKSVSDGSENVRLPTEIACVKGAASIQTTVSRALVNVTPRRLNMNFS